MARAQDALLEQRFQLLQDEIARLATEVKSLRLAIERKEAMDQATLERLIQSADRNTSATNAAIDAFKVMAQQLRDSAQPQPGTQPDDAGAMRKKVLEIADQLDANADRIGEAITNRTAAEGDQT